MIRPVLYVFAPYMTRTTSEADETDEAISKAIDLGWAPIFAPYALDRVLDDRNPVERVRALECCRSYLEVADAGLVVGDRVTEGMRHDLAAWAQCQRRSKWIFKHPDIPGVDALARSADPFRVNLQDLLKSPVAP